MFKKEVLLKEVFSKGDKLYSEKIFSDKKKKFPECEFLKKNNNFGSFVNFLRLTPWFKNSDLSSYENFAIVYNQGSYFYLIDTKTDGFPIWYITIDSPDEIEMYVISKEYPSFFNQLNEIPEKTEWVKDNDTLYHIRCSSLTKLQNWVKRIFVKREAQVCGILALVLVEYYDCVEFVGDQPSYSLEDLGVSKLTDKRFSIFLRSLKETSSVKMDYGDEPFGVHGKGILLPTNVLAQSMFY